MMADGTTRCENAGYDGAKLVPLVSELAGDADIADLVVAFVGELPSRSNAIREAARVGDVAMLVRLAHQLKGAAGSYGFGAITDAAREVEVAAKSEPDTRLREAIETLAVLCRRARAA